MYFNRDVNNKFVHELFIIGSIVKKNDCFCVGDNSYMEYNDQYLQNCL